MTKNAEILRQDTWSTKHNILFCSISNCNTSHCKAKSIKRPHASV